MTVCKGTVCSDIFHLSLFNVEMTSHIIRRDLLTGEFDAKKSGDGTANLVPCLPLMQYLHNQRGY